jgi:diaminopimelate epimerase
MNITFTKMHGCGNDYIYFNCLDGKNIDVLSNPVLITELSDRRKGIGGDGVIVICPSDTVDAKMRIFNADGSEAKMCGNGIRCVGKYVHDFVSPDKETLKIDTLSGVKTLTFYNNGKGLTESVRVFMGKAEFSSPLVPVKLSAPEVVDYPFAVSGTEYRITCLSVGNPHCVIFFNEIENINIQEIGENIQNCKKFPEGVNIEFVKINNKSNLSMRVWERGSKETMACGTGACASAVAAILNKYSDYNTDITVNSLGGKIIINYTGENILMTGEAVKVYKGELFY